MRLIDADALKEVMCMDCDNRNLCKESPACNTVQQIDEQPTVEAEPVVYCKDCIYLLLDHRYYNDKKHKDYYLCERRMCWISASEFCSYGVKTDEVEE